MAHRFVFRGVQSVQISETNTKSHITQSDTTEFQQMRVLSDAHVQKLLGQLTAVSIKEYQKILNKALVKYNKDASLIPERTVVSRPELGAVHLFMPAFADRAGIKTLAGSSEGFKGAVMILDENNGDLKGVLNAMTLTAFRTALCSTLPLVRVFDTAMTGQTMTVFGNGLQAYWHTKLTLSLFSANVSSVQIAVRSINGKAKELHHRLQAEFPSVDVSLVDENLVDLKSSSVIYGCVPSTEPRILFNKLDLSHKVYISLIGSYKPHMAEVDDLVVQHALSKGKIIVDSYEHTLHEAGELIKNNATTEDVIEIGELGNFELEQVNGGDNLTLVKIVGLAIMDISVGTEILNRAVELEVGSVVEF